MQWIVPKEKGVSVNIIEMPDGSSSIGIFGATSHPDIWKSAIEAGFRISKSGNTLLRQGGIRKSESQKIFRGMSIENVPDNVVRIQRKRSNEVPSGVGADTQSVRFLGLNYMGRRVMESMVSRNRFLENQDENTSVLSEENITVPAAFLRATSTEDLSFCTDGFILRAREEFLRQSDFMDFCRTVYSDPQIDVFDPRLRKVQENIEASLFRAINAEFNRSGGNFVHAYSFAERIMSHLPEPQIRTSESIEFQQYSTPQTMALAAQYMLGDMTGIRILEPTIGNASLLSGISNAIVTGVEIDDARFALAGTMLKDAMSNNKTTLINGDFNDLSFGNSEFDVVISNPPFGGTKKTVFNEELSVQRIDFQIALKALTHRIDKGRSVFIIAADRENIFPGKEGLISGGSAHFFRWIADHYEFRVAEVAGSMYRKQGASYPTRMIAIGRKYTPEEVAEAMSTKKYRLTGRIPSISNHEELWNTACEFREFLEHSVSFSDKNGVADVVAQSPEPEESFGENEFQTQYIPMSGGETSAMIPKNLMTPQNIGFSRFLADNPDGPEEFVMRKLQIDEDGLKDFAPEQIDAVALGIWNMERNRALILADQTGMGKGRVVAAIMRWAAMNDRQVNFMSEKHSLFSDIYRDLRDIGSDEIMIPFIMNNDVRVVSMTGDRQDVIVNKTQGSVRNKIIESGLPSIEHGYNLMLSTYSQYNKEPSKSKKSAYIAAGSSGAVMVLDESHNAAGDSNTGGNIKNAIDSSSSVVYSSATYAKTRKNMAIYSKAFPKSVNPAILDQILATGGEPLLEIMSSMLCEDGVLVRREHDLSRLKFSVIENDQGRIQDNSRISDQVSAVLEAISYYSGDISSICSLANKKIKKILEDLPEASRGGARMGVSSFNFGSRLFSISRQFSLILNTEAIAQNAIRALNNGCKPVIVMEHTMESIVKQMLRTDREPENGTDFVSDDEIEVAEFIGREPLTMRDILSRLLDKAMTVSVITGYGMREKTTVVDLVGEYMDAAAAKRAVESLNDAVDHIRNLIGQVDDMMAMPIDQISHRIRESGYSVGEVSGRSTTWDIQKDGSVVPIANTREKNAEIFNFNSGQYDAIVLTRSGCTGISLHASESFSDQRQRILIEAQIALNVAERVQFFGRVNRRGQVSFPEIWSVVSGLPWENRMLAMQNMKLRKLSANTQSNRRNSAEMSEVPDMLNQIGNAVAKDLLLDNPDISRTLGIDMEVESDDEESASDESANYFINRLTGRLCLLPVSKQKFIYENLINDFKDKIDELTVRGENPLEARIFDVKGEIVENIQITPSEAEGSGIGSVFDSPVFAQKLFWTETAEPFRRADLVKRANESIAGSIAEGDFTEKPDGRSTSQAIRIYNSTIEPEDRIAAFDLTELMNSITESRDRASKEMVAPMVERRIKDMVQDGADVSMRDEAACMRLAEIITNDLINSEEANPVKRLFDRTRWLTKNLQNLTPGNAINMKTEMLGEFRGFITDLRITKRDNGKCHLLGDYRISVVRPGSRYPTNLSLASLFEDETYNPVVDYSVLSGLLNEFDSSPAGEVSFSRWILSGNLFRASEMALASKIGVSGIYTTKDGARHRAIICQPLVDLKMISSSKVAISCENAVKRIIEDIEAPHNVKSRCAQFSIGVANINIFNSPEPRVYRLRLAIPGVKSLSSQFIKNKKLAEIIGSFSGTRKTMMATKEEAVAEDIKAVVETLYESGLYMTDSIEKTISAKPSSV